jgi:uncharacterized membrane protein
MQRLASVSSDQARCVRLAHDVTGDPMSLHLALYELAAAHGLDAQGLRRLQALAGLDREPTRLAHWVVRGTAVLAAALAGLGIVFWVAANWDTLGRFGRFALLQAIVVVMCAGALWRPAARSPLALLAMLGIGGLFAHFGQTYQTGADPWQLFALWALLALPLCLSVRGDVLWAPWALVAMTAVSLWVHAHTGHRWRVVPGDLAAHVIGWGAALALATWLSPWPARITGAGAWSLHTAVTLAVAMLTLTALGGLFQIPVAPHYWLALALLGGTALTLSLPRAFDVFALSVVALGMDALLVVGLGRWLFDSGGGDTIGRLFTLGIVASGLLAASVALVMRIARRNGATKAAGVAA